MKLFGYYKNGALVQRGVPFLIKGSADGVVEISVGGAEYNHTICVNAENGFFRAEFPACEDYKNKYLLTVKNGEETEEITFGFGDVYLAMGQSNLSYPLSAVEDDEEWFDRAAKANVAFLNLYEVPDADGNIDRPPYPQKDFIRDYEWVCGGNEKIKNTSAICVQTATFLCEKGGIPTGFVQTAMGGLSAETYLSFKTASGNEEFAELLKRTERYATPEDFNTHGGRNYTQLAGVWNEKIAPLEGIRFKGILWYLGESSAYDYEFGRLFLKTMEYIVSDVRTLFGTIPFVAVQIAPEYYPYGDKFGYLYVNEALDDLQNKLEKIVTVPIYDVEPRWLKPNKEMYFHPIHTVNKTEVSIRCAAALSGEKPSFSHINNVLYKKDYAECVVETFGSALKTGEVNGFIIAGKNGKFYKANATVNGKNTVKVFSEEVKYPAKIAYAFTRYQDYCNLATQDGLPVMSYRSERCAVNDKYCFPPAYTYKSKTEIYENNFGLQAGFCRKVPVWTSGTIYRAAKVRIKGDETGITLFATPKNEDMFFFGVSPSVCLCGHEKGFDKFKYLKIGLSSRQKIDFFGLVFRTCDGEIYRFNLKNGDETAESLSLQKEQTVFTIALDSGISGDGGAAKFSPSFRKKICEAEFVFRSLAKKASVLISSVNFSDKPPKSHKNEQFSKKQSERSDIKLPQTHNKKH